MRVMFSFIKQVRYLEHISMENLDFIKRQNLTFAKNH